jgi:RimJ/RimL family protein N-acetyltransferase
MHYLFYVMDSQALEAAANAVGDPGNLEEWSPSLWKLLPPDAPFYPFCIWWVFHQLRIFKNRDYRVVFIREGDRVIHRTCLLPAFFRFPIMQPTDLNVATWTLAGHRRKGLATRTLQMAIERLSRPQRNIWYVTKETNLPSIRLAESMGFSLLGQGRRVSEFGFRILGHFILETIESPFARANTSTCVKSSAK